MKTTETIPAARRRRARVAAILGASALACPFATPSAFAQAAGEATVDQNTIIVTAQRCSEALEDVPAICGGTVAFRF